MSDLHVFSTPFLSSQLCPLPFQAGGARLREATFLRPYHLVNRWWSLSRNGLVGAQNSGRLLRNSVYSTQSNFCLPPSQTKERGTVEVPRH